MPQSGFGVVGSLDERSDARIPGGSILATAGIGFVINALLRVALIGLLGRGLDVSWSSLPGILLRGAFNDFVVIPGMLVPLAFVLAFMPARLRRNVFGRLVIGATFFATIYGCIYLAFIEYFFFEEFSSRLNLVAVDYLVSPTEVLINIWDSYPVVNVLLLTGGLTAAAMFAIRGLIRADLETSLRLRVRAAALGLLLVLAVALPSLISLDALARGSRYEDQMSFNGIHSFFEALRTNNISYPDYYRMLPEKSAFALLRQELKQDSEQWVSERPSDVRRRHVGSHHDLEGHNVIVIVEESLGCEHVGACGDTRGLTPNVDELARSGIFWSDAWATGTRTVRGLEAILTSLPPIPSKSIVKRPGSEHIATWGQVMANAGYQTSFLYGGYGTFDNMNHFFASNGFEISDRRDIDNPVFANIWGVSDEDLFRHALRYFDARAGEHRPFFSVVLSTSNHKPFTFREGVPGVPPHGGGRNAGVRYADFALGSFIREARGHSWFDNTVFVVLGDHGSRVYGHGEIPLPTYRIPVLIFGTGIAPRVFANPASQIDVAPTVLGLLGVNYTAPFFGRDVLSDPDPQRPIYVSHNHDVGMLVGDELAVLGLEKTSSVYHYDFAADKQTPLPYDRALIDRATASYESAFLLFSRGLYR